MINGDEHEQDLEKAISVDSASATKFFCTTELKKMIFLQI